MQYRYLGRTGMKVSELCLGAMTFGRESTEADSIQMMNRFVAAGGNFIDTANVYTRGVSEEIVGRWLRNRKRDDLVIATKARFPMGDGPNDLGLSRKHLLSAVEDSLRRLQTDYIDLYQTHRPDMEIPLDETLGALDDLVRQGKVRHIGSSTAPAWHVTEALWVSQRQHLARFVSEQSPYNLLDRRIENELIPMCQRHGLGVIPWSPLAMGM
ncbi:MAG: aldo/keto reductase, partial [Caldilineaceae bacterium]|nr:aldo/keto reductase [Caldilineaceae bacterium]